MKFALIHFAQSASLLRRKWHLAGNVCERLDTCLQARLLVWSIDSSSPGNIIIWFRSLLAEMILTQVSPSAWHHPSALIRYLVRTLIDSCIMPVIHGIVIHFFCCFGPFLILACKHPSILALSLSCLMLSYFPSAFHTLFWQNHPCLHYGFVLSMPNRQVWLCKVRNSVAVIGVALSNMHRLTCWKIFMCRIFLTMRRLSFATFHPASHTSLFVLAQGWGLVSTFMISTWKPWVPLLWHRMQGIHCFIRRGAI